jgi:EAL domain-containing protein (putative c-di-GMP-specific phosphodiesterase class I)
VYQPIMDLERQTVAGFEALARGPAGTTWAMPGALVGYAERVGRLPELDWICRAAACRGALAANLPPDMPLFVNVEPASSRVSAPPDLAEIIHQALDRLQIVAEVTERSVANDPAGLLAAIEQLRTYSNRIALDDVGVSGASQAMMSLVRPDVIKVDRGVVQDHTTLAGAAVIDAVRAEADRTGAVILAEGIETPEHLAAAKAIGATLGQGWLFSRPGPLPRVFEPSTLALPQLVVPPMTATTPFEVAQRWSTTRHVTTDDLLPLTRQLEDRGGNADDPSVLLTTFHSGYVFNGSSRRRYSDLAAHGVLTATFALDMPLEPGPHVRGCPLAADDPLIRERNVIVIGSQFAGGLFAKRRDTTEEGEPSFDLILSNDRELVLAAARPLIDRLRPA